jgi:hypothetical protein
MTGSNTVNTTSSTLMLMFLNKDIHLQALVISILNIGKLYLSKQAYNLAKRLVYDMLFNNILFLLASNSKAMLSSLL